MLCGMTVQGQVMVASQLAQRLQEVSMPPVAALSMASRSALPLRWLWQLVFLSVPLAFWRGASALALVLLWLWRLV